MAPGRVKQAAHQSLAKLGLLALACYLVLALEHIRTAGRPLDHALLAHINGSLAALARAPRVGARAVAPATAADGALPAQPPLAPTASLARHARALPACAASGAAARSFLMVFMGHSGSSALLSELGAHSQVHVENPELVDHQEVFNTSAALEATRAFFERGISYGKIPGFKIRPKHIMNEPQQWQQLVEQYDTRIIWQYRKNFFKGAVGEYKLRFLNDTSVVEGFKSNVTDAQRCERGSCSFAISDFSFLHDLVKQGWRSQRNIVSGVRIVSRGDCVREVPYEDYLHNRENTLKDMFRFLGLHFEHTEPSRFKATSDNLCEVVTNWEEVCQRFYVCPTLAYLLEDEINNCYCPFVNGSTELCDI